MPHSLRFFAGFQKHSLGSPAKKPLFIYGFLRITTDISPARKLPLGGIAGLFRQQQHYKLILREL